MTIANLEHGTRADALRLERCTDLIELERLEPAWRALWKRVPDATPFQSPAWLVPWGHEFGTAELRALAAFAGNDLVGLLPCYLVREGRVRKLLPLGISLSDYADALVAPEFASVVDALLDTLLAACDWDECWLPELPPWAMLLRARTPHDRLAQRSQGETCPFLSLPERIERLTEVIPPRMLRNLHQVRQRAARAGNVQMTLADATSLDTCLDDVFRLHELRWRERGGGVTADPRTRRFLRAAAHRLHAEGMLRVWVQSVDGRAIGAYFGMLAHGAAYAYLGGFDPAYPRLSPGTQVIGTAIEDAAREGAREFRFLRGGESYKYLWGARDRFNVALGFRRRSP